MITHGRRTYPPHIAEVQAIQVKNVIRFCVRQAINLP